MSSDSDYGVHKVVQNLRGTLQAYLEAQYHIKHPSLIEERRRLLEKPGTIYQLPYVECTPSYSTGPGYADLRIPESAKHILSRLSQLRPDVGIYPKPYLHQSGALETFLGLDEDLIVATGTGSGKTESFLMPILGSLAVEGAERPTSARLPGCRALLLYPMNALVNDQLGRIRRLFGDPRVAELLKPGRNRLVRFGSYTGRTPYPGERTGSKDARFIQPMFEEFYLKYLNDPDKVKQLSERGKWPSKDLERFFGADRIERTVYRTGARRGQPLVRQNWGTRLFTQEGDRELLTRHEIQASCPDILITNYSMLEYMLLRPIERSIFTQTKTWLASDPNNKFIVVLDEAHMYRGAGGAEVALLLRRLQARLGIPRERIRYILTSASLGEGPEAEAAVLDFARDLTGLHSASPRGIRLVKGERERRPPGRPASPDETGALAAFDLSALHGYSVAPIQALEAVRSLAARIGWGSPPGDPAELPDYLFRSMNGFGPLEETIRLISGKAQELTALGTQLFPTASDEQRQRGTEVLLALGTLARRDSDKRVLLPTRLHLFYRGLPALYACTSRKCDARLDAGREPGEYILGSLHTEPRTHCNCRDKARVYELLTHRDCGTAFLRAYVRGPRGGFLWHEPSREVGGEEAEALHEIHLLVEGDPHPDASTDAAEVWVDTSSGRILRGRPGSEDGVLRAFLPSGNPQIVGGRPLLTFERCPVCLRSRSDERSKIMDLSTKGEAPFANLVKAQVISQPPRMPEGPSSPNGGRKTLLFSDGRQKAARLARDIPREVELDSFRQAIALAARLLADEGREAKLTRELYLGFVAIASKHFLHLFDGADQQTLLAHQAQFLNYYGGQLAAALEDDWDVTPPSRYREALLRQLCSPFYSLQAATIGFVMPSRQASRRLQTDLSALAPGWGEAEVFAIACAWIHDLLSDFAFDKTIKRSLREVAAGYQRGLWGSQAKFRKALETLVVTGMGVPAANVTRMADVLRQNLCEEEKGLFFLNPNRISLSVDLERPWHQCLTCTFLGPVTLSGRCVHCGGPDVRALEPARSEYIRARKGFWRNPLADSIAGRSRPRHVTAEEHTAQLSQRDAGVVHATTERYELRFQDVVIGTDEGPIDVLSCTTTMEVGVDIGSLIAVGLRNVPPQRENYQQRAGRSGRRGSAVSTVVTYGQGGHHDSYYFHNPVAIVSGPPRRPLVKIDNPKICRRHVHAFLFQTFFHDAIDRGVPGVATQSAVISKALGRTADFFEGPVGSQVNLESFASWVRRGMQPGNPLLESVVSWVPEPVSVDRVAWVKNIAEELLARLEVLKVLWKSKKTQMGRPAQVAEPEEGEEPVEAEDEGEESDELLSFLFDQGVLPTYAFPTDLCSFLVEEISRKQGRTQVVAKERPQQAIAKALSEYAPGRLIVIDKRTYRSGGVAAAVLPSEHDRAAPLFARGLKRYVYCRACAFVQDPDIGGAAPEQCPLCGGEIGSAEMLQPQVFHPEGASEVDETDRDQEFTYATAAQFPVPAGEGDLGPWKELGTWGKSTHSSDRKLVVVNRGRKGEDNGFEVCESCGTAKPQGTGDPIPPRHQRPYLVQTPNGQQPSPCNGRIRNVFLGHSFTSDLVLLRIKLQSPLATNMRSSLVRNVLDDSLRSLSEALLLASSRFLDIDPSEFSAGYRIVPGPTPDQKGADVYLFDTLAGGAGYSDQAGRSLDDVLRETSSILQNCPGRCDRSCYQCLRHYANQYWHERLDRHLALALLRWMAEGTVPATTDLRDQANRLAPLKRMLELEGYACESGTTVSGCEVPLLVRGREKSVAVGSYPGQLDVTSSEFNHPIKGLRSGRGIQVELVSDYLLTRNLPTAYQQIRGAL